MPTKNDFFSGKLIKANKKTGKLVKEKKKRINMIPFEGKTTDFKELLLKKNNQPLYQIYIVPNKKSITLEKKR